MAAPLNDVHESNNVCNFTTNPTIYQSELFQQKIPEFIHFDYFTVAVDIDGGEKDLVGRVTVEGPPVVTPRAMSEGGLRSVPRPFVGDRKIHSTLAKLRPLPSSSVSSSCPTRIVKVAKKRCGRRKLNTL